MSAAATRLFADNNINMDAWNKYMEVHKQRFLEELAELLRIPSIGTRPDYKGDVEACAAAFRQALLKAGADHAAVFPTEGHPVVYGEKLAGADKPTILVYGHYDVQPPEPLELWLSDPFDPEIRDGKLYARGSSDDKGQVFMHIKALEILERTGGLSCNVKFLIEGEEEVGSGSLLRFVDEHRALLACDVTVVSDSAMLGLQTPSIEVGLRGLSYVEVTVQGPNRDLHSGIYGGAVANPALILARMLASLHDGDNHIAIPGFYDDVVELSAAERAGAEAAPFDEAAYRADLGVDALWGEKGYTTRERVAIRPTLEINGIWSGYTGEGAKTVLPSKAQAKISCRLVPDQSSRKITRLLKEHLEKLAPPGVRVGVRVLQGGEPFLTPVDSAAYRAASFAMEHTLGHAPVPVRSGGSIPILRILEDRLKVKVVLLGFGLDSDNLHGPNEKLDVENFYKGIETILWFQKYFAAMRWTEGEAG